MCFTYKFKLRAALEPWGHPWRKSNTNPRVSIIAKAQWGGQVILWTFLRLQSSGRWGTPELPQLCLPESWAPPPRSGSLSFTSGFLPVTTNANSHVNTKVVSFYIHRLEENVLHNVRSTTGEQIRTCIPLQLQGAVMYIPPFNTHRIWVK